MKKAHKFLSAMIAALFVMTALSVTVSDNGTDAGEDEAVGAAGDWKTVSTGWEFTVAVKSDGSLWAWGKNDVGQLGLGDTDDRHVPTQIGSATDWATVSAGMEHALAIKTTGELYAWGVNDKAQLGLGDHIDRDVPTQVGTANDWAMVSAGSYHTAAIKTDGTLWIWGYNTSSGYLGLGVPASYIKSPAKITSVGDNWKMVSAGYRYTAAIKTTGELYAWGFNDKGQIGDGTTVDKTSPTRIEPTIDWATVSAGDYAHTMAITTTGKLYTWGLNDKGQLGDNTLINKTSPIQIGSATDWAAVSASSEHSAAVKTTGELYTWGRNDKGQLGTGDTSDKKTPTQVTSPSVDWAMVSAGGLFTAAISDTGELYVWGYNQSGQIGDGTYGFGTSKSTPTLIEAPPTVGGPGGGGGTGSGDGISMVLIIAIVAAIAVVAAVAVYFLVIRKR